MNRPAFELAEIIWEYRNSFIQKHAPLKQQLRVLNAIAHCRTAYLGGHVDRCNECGHSRISYNSCRNRHCPKCQGTNRERWILARQDDLLPVSYFHVVFTLPQELNAFCLRHPVQLYNILFRTAKETILTFGNDHKYLGAKTGLIAILHTWGQNLTLHPHVHCIVPAGGITNQGKWKNHKNKSNFLFPVKAMSMVYKAKFMENLIQFLIKGNMPLDKTLRKQLYSKHWIVYAKQPFGGPKQVIEYLGRYSHKIAISNHRIKSMDNGIVSFTYKDYAHGNVKKIMFLGAGEFLRRFCLHILPPKFMKIRHYGILASRNKPILKMQQMKMGMNFIKPEKKSWQEISKTYLGFDPQSCPCCKSGKMIRILSFDAHGPPKNFMKQLKHNIIK